jgi:predicted AAA+ superfamily ATPase
MVISVVAKKMVEMFLLLFYCGFRFLAILKYNMIQYLEPSLNTGHILENIVYLEILRRGYKVYVGSMTGGEVDFVTKDAQDRLAYYQVSEFTLQPESWNGS